MEKQDDLGKKRGVRAGETRVGTDRNETTAGRKNRIFSYGAVTVKSLPADRSTAQANVAVGQLALTRAKDAFIKAGVSLRHRKGIPRFQVDAHEPSIIIRVLEGRIERGRMVNGAFVPTE